MAGAPHDILVMALRDSPALLAELVKRVARCSMGEPVTVLDSTVRSPRSIEVRPDLVLGTRRRGWAMVEVQNRIDVRKRKSWPIAMTQILHERRRMGDLIVVTASRRVAVWAKRAAHLRTDGGTRLELTPMVVLIAGSEIEMLLDPARPELALFAAWAMHKRRGSEALEVVDRAVELVGELPEALQGAATHAIVGVLSKPMLAFLKERAMIDVSKIPESPAARRFRLFFERRGIKQGKVEGKAEGKAEGKREALLTFLAARGLSISERDRIRIEACTSVEDLDRWIERAATATSVRAVFKAPQETVQRAAPKAPVKARKRAAPKRAAG